MISLLLVPACTAAALWAAAWLWAGAYDTRPTLRLLASLVATSGAIVLLEVLLALGGVLATAPLAIAAWLLALGGIGAWIVRRTRFRCSGSVGRLRSAPLRLVAASV